MSFIYGERLIEYAIRIGTDDLMKSQELVDYLFYPTKNLNQGRNVTPPDSPQNVYEKLPFDYFQERLSKIPRTPSETGDLDLFKNPFPTIPDIIAYLNECNISIVHGYPPAGGNLPCISIVLGNEDETKFLGGQQIDYENGLGGKPSTEKGSNFNAQYNVSILSTNYDEVELWYFIMKYSIMAYKAVLDGYGLSNIAMSFMDIEPAPDYIQAGLFCYQRTMILSTVKQESIMTPAPGYSELSFQVTSNGYKYPQGPGPIVPSLPDEEELL